MSAAGAAAEAYILVLILAKPWLDTWCAIRGWSLLERSIVRQINPRSVDVPCLIFCLVLTLDPWRAVSSCMHVFDLMAMFVVWRPALRSSKPRQG